MRIIYVAKHDQTHSNDDEGAITHALTSLGHDVQRLREIMGHKVDRMHGDFVLFHNWQDLETISRIPLPKVFWYFDLVNWPGDRSLHNRNVTRMTWASEVTRLCSLGFMTDGDWVSRDRTGKLVQLMQGADERVMGPGKSREPRIELMFAGIRNGGLGRSEWVDRLQSAHGEGFKNVRRTYGRALADVIASSDIVLAPDSPVTDRYCSNRVYMTLGFQGFLLHPRCEQLERYYRGGRHLVYYDDAHDLDYKISYYLTAPGERGMIAAAGFQETAANHTYRVRCAELIRVVKERLGL